MPTRKGSSRIKPKLRRSGALEIDEETKVGSELQMPTRKESSTMKPKLRRSGAIELDEE